MYLRSTPRRNKDGSEVRYLQLAHNVWDQQKRRSAVQVVYNFGREDTANREALQRLVASVTRFLDPDTALAAAADGLEFTESRPLGGIWVLDALWSRLGPEAAGAGPWPVARVPRPVRSGLRSADDAAPPGCVPRESAVRPRARAQPHR
jgi:hypothetical protein